MTGPSGPPGSEVPESAVSELHALYRDAARAEPGALLDRSILEAARAELKADQMMKSRRPRPWWRSWLPVTSAIAVALIGLSVTWRVIDEQERDLRQELKAAQGAPAGSGDTAASAPPARRAAEAMPTIAGAAPPAATGRRAGSAAVKDSAVGVPEPPAMSAPAAPAAMAPPPPEQAVKKRQRAETDELPERRDAGFAAESASAPLRQAGKLEAGSLGASGATAADSVARPAANSAAKSVAVPTTQAADPPTADAWLKHIRELRAAGRVAEAAQSLARFRVRYPDFALPADLLDLK